MVADDAQSRSALRSSAQFATTHWSVVLAAGQYASPQAAAALEQLCRTYWYPLYAFIRRQGCGVDEAKDLVQGFFQRLGANAHAIGLAVSRLRQRYRECVRGEIAHTVTTPAEVEKEMHYVLEVLGAGQ